MLKQRATIKHKMERIIRQTANRLGYDITRLETKIVSDAPPLKIQGVEELANNYTNYQVLKLHFGCGPRILKGWINIDLIYASYEDYLEKYTDRYYPENIRGDLSDFYRVDITQVGLPLSDSSVDVVFHEDFLEHLDQKQQIIFLAETLRVLKPGAVHRVNTPDLASSMREHSDFSIGIGGVYTDEWNRWYHLNVLTPTMLQEMADIVGYSKVIFNKRDESTSSLVPMEYRPAEDRAEHEGNIFADLIK